ncbi:MAG: hypothetical protein ABUL72_04240, partial [Armatimonadota bacterium]
MSDSSSTLVLVLSDILGGEEEVLRSAPKPFVALSEVGQVCRLAPSVRSSVPEAAWLGIDPVVVNLAPGPLVVAALGVDPPDKSVHFQLDLLSVDEEGKVVAPDALPTPAEMLAVKEAGSRLATKRLTALFGDRFIHGLVWEQGSLDLGCTPSSEAVCLGVHTILPQGDGEP